MKYGSWKDNVQKKVIIKKTNNYSLLNKQQALQIRDKR